MVIEHHDSVSEFTANGFHTCIQFLILSFELFERILLNSIFLFCCGNLAGQSCKFTLYACEFLFVELSAAQDGIEFLNNTQHVRIGLTELFAKRCVLEASLLEQIVNFADSRIRSCEFSTEFFEFTAASFYACLQIVEIMQYDIDSQSLITLSESQILCSFLRIFLQTVYTPFDLDRKSVV